MADPVPDCTHCGGVQGRRSICSVTFSRLQGWRCLSLLQGRRYVSLLQGRDGAVSCCRDGAVSLLQGQPYVCCRDGPMSLLQGRRYVSAAGTALRFCAAGTAPRPQGDLPCSAALLCYDYFIPGRQTPENSARHDSAAGGETNCGSNWEGRGRAGRTGCVPADVTLQASGVTFLNWTLRRHVRTLTCAGTRCLLGFSHLGDARLFSRLTSKIPPLASMLNFDADVKKGPRVTNAKTTLGVASRRVPATSMGSALHQMRNVLRPFTSFGAASHSVRHALRQYSRQQTLRHTKCVTHCVHGNGRCVALDAFRRHALRPCTILWGFHTDDAASKF